jgi:hypothetical protein
MKLTDLPQGVLNDLCQADQWRLDIDPGVDSKHEFWMSWHHFLTFPEPSYSPRMEEDLAEFLKIEGYDILLPVARALRDTRKGSHHDSICSLRLIPSVDQQTLTLFLQDSYYRDWFTQPSDAQYGFMAIADHYQKFDCDFYIASYYHFSYLIGKDYEVAVKTLSQKLGERS